MYAYPLLLPPFSNREDLLLTIGLFDDDTGDAIELSGRTLAIPGDFTGAQWTVTIGATVSASTTSLTIPDFPIGSQLSTVTLTIGENLNVVPGQPVTIADPTGKNTMTGYVLSYAPASGVLVCQIGIMTEFEIRREGPHHYRDGYSFFYDIGTMPEYGPIISAQLGNSILIIGTGMLEVLIPAATFQRLHRGTFLCSMNITDSVNTRQLFVGQLPVAYGGVAKSPINNPSASTWENQF